MAGTKAGGLKAAQKNLAKNPNFYADIGAKGGSVKGTRGGFAADSTCFCDEFEWAHQKRQCAGKKGGRVSRRKKNG